MKTQFKILLASIFCLSIATAHAAQIDCDGTLTTTESAICNDQDLVFLDEVHWMAYDVAEIMANDTDYLKEFAKGHLDDRDGICGTDKECLTNWYNNRTDNYMDWENIEAESMSGGH